MSVKPAKGTSQSQCCLAFPYGGWGSACGTISYRLTLGQLEGHPTWLTT